MSKLIVSKESRRLSLIVLLAVGLLWPSSCRAQDDPLGAFDQLSAERSYSMVNTVADSSSLVSPKTASSLAGRQILIDPRWYGERPIFGSFQCGYPLILKPKELVLTFDDGPNPETTPRILDAMKAFGVKGTFFLQGDHAEQSPEIVKRMVEEGHTIGYHTYDHPKLTTLSDEKVEDNILRGMRAVNTAAYGTPESPYANAFRPPYLSFERELLKELCGKHTMALFSIDGDPKDYANRPAPVLVESVLDTVSDMEKGMLLFHDTQEATAEAMPTILRELAARGYTIVDMKMNER